MGNCRFLFQNLMTDETMISVSSLRNGMVTSAKKEGTGSAIITTSGNFTGATDLEYIVEIDSIAGGAEVGQATFRWSDGGGTWDADGVLTAAAPTALNNGVNIAFTTGTGADFVVGDRWYFKGVNLFNAGKMIDLERDHRYRSAELSSPNTITIDLSTFSASMWDTGGMWDTGTIWSVDSGIQAQALILFDHNLTLGATITLEADDQATFDSDGGNPALTQSITWVERKIIHYLGTTYEYKYWRIKITDTSNPDGFIEIGELFIGPYMELSRTYREKYRKPISLIFDKNTTPYGVNKKRLYNQQRSLEYDFNGLVAADLTLLEALLNGISNRTTGRLKPFFFNDDSATTANTWLVDIEAIPETHMTRDYYETTLEMQEVVKTI